MTLSQKRSSAGTSLNQVPALHKWFIRQHVGSLVSILDYGCGKHERGMNYLRSHGHTVMCYDPYNRPDWSNQIVMSVSEVFNVGLCANVLNVIDHDEALLAAITDVRDMCHVSYFSVYEGDRTGIGKETTRGYQRNARIHAYVNILDKVFKSVTKDGKILICY